MTTSSLTATEIAHAQERLRALGHPISTDETGVVGATTATAVEAFQNRCALPVTGLLDAETLERLHEASWQLGSRLLFVTRPAIRGDDVAVLQEKLALLGFDPGRIDGIFGVLTEHALSDFQGNCGLEATGVLTRATLNELHRLSSRSEGRRPVTEARDEAGLRSLHHSGTIVVHGVGVVPALIANGLSAAYDVNFTDSHDDREGANLANDVGAAVLLATTEQTERQIEIHYFASYRSRSILGEQWANEIATAIAAHTDVPVSTRGMSLPILRETFMPALHVAIGPLDDGAQRNVAGEIVSVTRAFLNSPR